MQVIGPIHAWKVASTRQIQSWQVLTPLVFDVVPLQQDSAPPVPLELTLKDSR